MRKNFTLLYICIAAMAGLLNPQQALAQCAEIGKGSFVDNNVGCVQTLNVQFELRYNDLDNDATVYIDWGDGTLNSYSYATDPAYFTSPTDFNYTFSHMYPAGMGVCEYTIEGWAESACQNYTNTLQQQSVTVWDRDDFMEVDVPVYQVCQGTSANIIFHDAGTWNCFLNSPSEPKNLEDRTLQWSYGVSNSGNPSNLQGVVVNGMTNPVNYVDAPFVTSGQGNPSQGIFVPATRPDGSPHTVGDVFYVKLANWNQCNPFPMNAPITTYAQIVIVDPPDPTITNPAGPFCIDEAIDFSVPSGAGLTYSWDFGDGNISTVNNPTHSYASEGTYTVNVEVANSNIVGSNCLVSASTTVTVLKSPVADFDITTSSADACGSATLAINNTALNSDGYEWTITPPTGGTASYTSTTTNNTTPNPANLTLTGVGEYQIQLRATSTSVPGCPSVMEKSFFVYDTPVAGFTADEVCYDDVTSSGVVTFVNTSSIPVIIDGDSIDLWEWDFNYDGTTFNVDQTISGSFPASFTHDFVNVGVYRVGLRVSTAKGACTSTVFDDYVEVNPLPEVGLNVISPTEGCAPFTVDFENLKPDFLQPVAIDEFELLVEDGAGNSYTSLVLDKDTENFSYTFDNPTTSVVTYYVALVAKSQDACSQKTAPSIEITVNPSQQVSYNTTGYSPLAANCAPVTVDFDVDGTFATNFPAAQYTWTIVDPDGAYDTLVVGPNTDLANTFTFRNHFEDSLSDAGIAYKEYEVTLEAESGSVCIRPYTEVFRVNPVPASTFVADIIDENCDKVTIKLKAFQPGLADYKWVMYENGVANTTLPDDLSEVEVVLNRPASGTADLTLDFELQTTNGFGCVSGITTKTSEIVIPAKEAVNVVLDSLGALNSNFNSCNPLSIEFENKSTTTASGVVYELMVSPSSTFEPKAITSGDINGVFTYEFPGAGNYELKLRATTLQGCIYESSTRLIKVNPEVDATFDVDKLNGCGPLDVTLTPLNTSDVSQWIWTVTRLSDNVQVHYSSNATPASVLTTLTNTTNVHEQYEAQLEVRSAAGCTDIQTQTITVFPETQVGFDLVGNPVCPPFEFEFINTSDNPVGTTYTWNWGDGTQSSYVSTSVVESGTLTHDYINRNFFSGNDSYTVRLTAELPDGCTETVAKTITLRPDLLADYDILYDASGCAPLKVEVYNFSLGANNVEWSYREQGQTAWTLLSTNPSSHNFILDNNTSAVKTYEVRLLAMGPDDGSGFCTDEDIRTVEVQPKVEADFSVPAMAVCSEQVITFENLIRKAGIQYSWNWGDGSPVEVTTDAQATIQHAFANNSPYGNRNFTVTLTAEDITSGCSVQLSKQVSILPDINVDIQPSVSEGCAPLTVSFNNLSQGTNEQQWFVKQGGFTDLSSQSTDYNYEYTFENTTSDTLYYEVFFEGKNVVDCAEDTMIVITVFPEISADFTMTPQAGACSPSVYDFKVTDENPRATYFWDFGDGTFSDQAEEQHAFTNTSVSTARVFNVSLYAKDTVTLCGTVVTKKVTVNPMINARIQADYDGNCAPLQVNFRNRSELPDTHSWFYRVAGSSDTLEINHDFEPNNGFVFENTTADTLTYEVIYIGENLSGCTDSDTLLINVMPQVTAEFEALTDDVCSPLEVRLVNQDPSARPSMKYTWEFGDGSPNYVTTSKDTIVHVYTNPSSYSDKTFQVKLTTEDTLTGCSITSAPQIIFVPKKVEAVIEASQWTTCGQQTLEFNNGAVNLSYVDNFEWTLVKGGNQVYSDSSSQILSYDFPANTTTATEEYILSLRITSSNGCESIAQDTVKVFPTPVLDFEIVGDTAACYPYEFTFRNNSTAPDSTQFTWYWGDGAEDGLSDAEVYHTYDHYAASNKERTIVLEASTPNGCTARITKKILLKGFVDAEFRLIAPYQACAPASIEIIQASVGDNDPGSIWEVRKDGGAWEPLFTSGFEPEVILENTTLDNINYDIRYTAKNLGGCEDIHIESVEVLPQVVADYTILNVGDDILCPPYEVTFQNNNIREGVIYTWNFGDGSEEIATDQEIVSHVFENASFTQDRVRNVTLTAVDETSGCEDSYTESIVIQPSIRMDLTPSDTIGCAPLTVSFENYSLGVSKHEWRVELVGGLSKVDSSSVSSPTFNLDNNTDEILTYRVHYTASSGDGCVKNEVTEIKVYPKLPTGPVFAIDSVDMNLPNTEINITNLYPYKDSDAWTYSWHFGDSTFSDQAEPGAHSYETYGIYYVTLTMSNGYCEKTFDQKVVIHAIDPMVDFTAGRVEGCSPVTVQFENLTKYADADSYEWEFGDGSRSTAANPEHTFYNPGVYTVTLSAMNDTGKRIEIVKEDLVVVHDIPVVLFDVRPDTVYLPEQFLYTANRTQGVGDGATYFWDFGDGNVSYEREPAHKYAEEGIYDITLAVTNKWGCSDTVKMARAVQVKNGGDKRVPNAFTPNLGGPSGGSYSEDGSNDVFIPKVAGVTSFRMLIFNRWGELLFESNSQQVGWDGYYNGRLSPQGVYVYQLFLVFKDGRREVKVGDVTLIR